MSQKEYINPKLLILDAGTQPRLSLDKDTIAEYGELLKTAKGGETPESRYPFKESIQVVRTPEGKLIVWDGFHRTHGALETKTKEVEIEITDGTLEDAILLSVGANADHGFPRSRKDKQRAVKTLLANPTWAEWNNSEIARHAKVSESMVREIRSVAQTPAKVKVKRAGRVVEVAKKGEGKKAKAKAAKAGAPGKPAKSSDDDLARAITRVGHIAGGEAGKKFKQGVEDGSLAISPKELTALAAAPESTIKKVVPLVVDRGMKPSKAIEFLDAPLDDKTTLRDLIDLAISNKGKLVENFGGAKITIVIE